MRIDFVSVFIQHRVAVGIPQKLALTVSKISVYLFLHLRSRLIFRRCADRVSLLVSRLISPLFFA